MHPLRAYLHCFVPGLPDADWQPLAEALRVRHLARGEHFFQAGDYLPVLALQPSAFTPRTTDSTHGKRCAPNLVLAQPHPTQANRVWVSDITYLLLACGQGVYCYAFQDVCTKQVVGWQVRADMPEALVTTALQRALLAQRPAPGLIVHADRGGQYVGNSYKNLLRDAKAQLSHSRRGECYDNAQAESLWLRLKTKLLELRDWPVFLDLAAAQASVAEYFDYYNHYRRRASIG